MKRILPLLIISALMLGFQDGIGQTSWAQVKLVAGKPIYDDRGRIIDLVPIEPQQQPLKPGDMVWCLKKKNIATLNIEQWGQEKSSVGYPEYSITYGKVSRFQINVKETLSDTTYFVWHEPFGIEEYSPSQVYKSKAALLIALEKKLEGLK